MSLRYRKLIGTVVLFVLFVVYILAVTVAAGFLQVRSDKWIEMIFYVIGGLAWVFPAATLIRWMQRADIPPFVEKRSGR